MRAHLKIGEREVYISIKWEDLLDEKNDKVKYGWLDGSLKLGMKRMMRIWGGRVNVLLWDTLVEFGEGEMRKRDEGRWEGGIVENEKEKEKERWPEDVKGQERGMSKRWKGQDDQDRETSTRWEGERGMRGGWEGEIGMRRWECERGMSRRWEGEGERGMRGVVH